jgi:hypothetical protein
MRTTLDIDDDVLSAAEELAAAQKISAGKVISNLARNTLIGPQEQTNPEYRNGFRLMPKAGFIVTPEMVRRLLEDDI